MLASKVEAESKGLLGIPPTFYPGLLSYHGVRMQVLVDLGLVTEQELQDSIASEFNPVHIGFHSKQQGPDIVAEDVLNLGVSPR